MKKLNPQRVGFCLLTSLTLICLSIFTNQNLSIANAATNSEHSQLLLENESNSDSDSEEIKTGKFSFTAKPVSQHVMLKTLGLYLGKKFDPRKHALDETIELRDHRGRLKKIKDLRPNVFAIDYNVYVPKSYDGKAPYGLLVYIDSGGHNNFPDRLKKVCDEKKLIWIGPKNAGNNSYVFSRHCAAVHAVFAIQNQNYKIADSRVYIAGFSGGARMAARVALTFPTFFRGAILAGGIEMYRSVNGAPEKGFNPSRKDLKTAAKLVRIYAVVGTADKMLPHAAAKVAYKTYKKDGFKINYDIVKGRKHIPATAKDVEKALKIFDKAGLKHWKKLYKKALKFEKGKKLGKALPLFQQAAAYAVLSKSDDAKNAIKKAAKYYDMYYKERAKVEKLLNPFDYKAIKKALSKFCKRWHPYTKIYKKKMLARIKYERKKAKSKK